MVATVFHQRFNDDCNDDFNYAFSVEREARTSNDTSPKSNFVTSSKVFFKLPIAYQIVNKSMIKNFQPEQN